MSLEPRDECYDLAVEIIGHHEDDPEPENDWTPPPEADVKSLALAIQAAIMKWLEENDYTPLNDETINSLGF